MNVKLSKIGYWIAAGILGLGVATSVRAQQAQPAAAPAKEQVAAMDAPWSNPLPPGRLNLGIHFGDQQVESFGDIVAPIIQFKSGLMFVNPRGTWNDDDGQEFNLGLGYRHLFPDRNIIVGGNVFYDLRNTSLDNTFNQFGCGLEFLSTWVDARVNVYLPEGGKKTADEYATATSQTQERGSYWYAPTGQGNAITQYGYDVTSTYDVKTLQHYQISEQAMDGFDGEIGALLPIPVIKDVADVKAFVGFYDYNAHYGDDLAGMKGRLEIKPMPSVYLDAAWFEDKALLGSRYSVGARVSMPFDLANLSRGKNPFAGALEGFKPGAAKPAFASRMTEMVVRDLHIRTDVSEPEEVVSDRKILEKLLVGTDRKDYNLVLASGVTFVDDDNRSGVENGTWENPYRQINTGVQRAVGTMVYVRDAAQQYYENVVLREGLTLWGSGAPIYGQGDRFLGGIYPVVNGLGRGPAITLASHVTVAGFEITQQIPAYPPQVKGERSYLAGIYGEDVTDVSIHHNYIHNTETGIRINAFSIPSFSANISDNRIEDVRSYEKRDYGGSGIELDLYGIPRVDVTLANNTVTRCGDGLAIYADGNYGDTFIARISGNYSGNYGNGVYMNVNFYELAAGLFVDTVANNNGRDGIYASFYDNYLSAVLLASHADLERIDKLVGAVAQGIPFLPMGLGDGFNVGDLLGVRGLYREGGSMQANGNGANGIYVNQSSDNGINLAGVLGVQANDNGWNNPIFDEVSPPKEIGASGINIRQTSYSDYPSVSVAAVIRSEAKRNEGSGIDLYSEAENLALNVLVDVMANDNWMYGIHSYTYANDGWAGGVVLASAPLLSLVKTVSESPLLSGMIGPMDLSFIPSSGQVQANGNGASGISLYAGGYDAAFGVVLDAQANGNGLNFIPTFKPPMANGVEVNVNSENGAAVGVVGSTEALMGLLGPILESESVPLDLSKVRTLGSLQANDNANNGVYVYASSTYGDAMVGIAGVEAQRNGWWLTDKNGFGGDGINLYAYSQYGDAMAGLANVKASGNASDGIYANVNAMASDGEAMVGGINIKANDNGYQGVEMDIHSQSPSSSYLVLAGVEANRNAMGSGIDIRMGGEGVVMAALTGIQANDNGARGIAIETDSSFGDSHVWISETAVQDMSDHGGGWDFLGLDVISMLPSGAIETSDNGGSGIAIACDGGGNTLVDVGDVTASGNSGNGIEVESSSYDGHANVYLHGNTTSGNGSNGIQVAMSASTDATIEMRDNVSNENGADGLRANVTTGNYLTLTGRSNVAKDNGGDGIDVTALAGSGSYDFGTEADAGNNALAGNTDFGMRWADESGRDDQLSAQNNYWAGEPDYYGNILADPYLTDDPSVP